MKKKIKNIAKYSKKNYYICSLKLKQHVNKT
jgi:hypothetical protein